jgi:Glycosyl transferase family 2
MTVRAISMLGGDVAVVPQMIAHYRGLGVESFVLIRHAEHADDPVLHATEQIVRAAGLELHQTHIGPWHEDLNATLIERAMARYPGDWFIVADLDELHVFNRPLAELLDWCDRHGYDAVEGCYLDRVAADGTFPKVTDASLWDQFPLAGGLSFPLLGATPTKVVAARGRVRLDLGHHTARNARPAPHREVYAQVHHFKWNDSVVERTRIRKSRFQSGAWRLTYPSVLSETIRFLDHVAAHDGRIDVAEPLFMFHPCGDRYLDHPQWMEMVRWVHLHWPAGW